jgi:hypothetical protein
MTLQYCYGQNDFHAAGIEVTGYSVAETFAEFACLV